MGRAHAGRQWASAVGWALALLGTGAIPTSGRAQQPAGTADALNQALVRYAFRYDGGNARLVPGRVPDDLAPNFYAPPGTRVLGTIVGGSSAVVLATTDAPPDSVRAQYARALEARGWRAWVPRQRGGFVESAAEGPLIFCRAEANLHITHRRRATPPHDLHLEYREGAGTCQESAAAERMEFVGVDRPRLPTLRSPEPPPGRPRSTCYLRGSPGRSGGSFATSTTVSTDLGPAGLLQHYARQLEAAGWAPPSRAPSPAIVSGLWTRSDSTGATQVVTLEVTERTPGSGCYEVQMTVER